ncbi:MAG: DUF1667 domain-containing protein [Allobaculum sp.]
METRQLICINCPMGCHLSVSIEEGKAVKVTGNTCPKGHAYGISEVTHPLRMVTTIVPVNHGIIPMVSCKTTEAVEKEKVFEVIAALKNVQVEAPVKIGDILIRNVADTSVDVVATKEVAAA